MKDAWTLSMILFPSFKEAGKNGSESQLAIEEPMSSIIKRHFLPPLLRPSVRYRRGTCDNRMHLICSYT